MRAMAVPVRLVPVRLGRMPGCVALEQLQQIYKKEEAQKRPMHCAKTH